MPITIATIKNHKEEKVKKGKKKNGFPYLTVGP